MILEVAALLCTGVFAGAAIYVSAVEHPARLQCGVCFLAGGLAGGPRRRGREPLATVMKLAARIAKGSV